MVVQAKIFGYTKFCLATLKTPSLEVDPRLEIKTEIRAISTHQINFVDLC